MKKKRWIFLIILLFLTMLACAAGILVWMRPDGEEDGGAGVLTVQAADGQTVSYVTLYTVRGNEITYYETGSGQEAVQMSTQGAESPAADAQGADAPSAEPQSADVQEKEQAADEQGAESSAADAQGADAPSAEHQSADAPSAEPQSADVQEKEQAADEQGAESPAADAQEPELHTALIPVGTPVITKLGTTTTFSRLAAGDSVALVISGETGEIETVYIR